MTRQFRWGTAKYYEFTDHLRQGSDWDEDTIIRVFVSRCEIDLRIIADKFQDLSGRNLYKSIQQDSGGDFQSILLKILKPDLKLAQEHIRKWSQTDTGTKQKMKNEVDRTEMNF